MFFPPDKTAKEIRVKSEEELRQEAQRREKQDREVQLYQATVKGDWNAAKTIINEHQDIVRQVINSNKDIALHIAVAAKHTDFVRDLLGEMNSDDLALRNNNDNTVLHFAAASGVVEIAKMLIEKNQYLPNLSGPKEIKPILSAALFGHGEMVMYLYEKTNVEALSDKNLIDLFTAIISADVYGKHLILFSPPFPHLTLNCVLMICFRS